MSAQTPAPTATAIPVAQSNPIAQAQPVSSPATWTQPPPPNYEPAPRTLRESFAYTFCPNAWSKGLWVVFGVLVFVGAIILIAASQGATWEQGRADDQSVGYTLVLGPLILCVGGTGLWLANALRDRCRKSRQTTPPYSA
eukprot:CAMPEP_0206058022 /NCGR_PEP_ID=MMETSP1466-20131121/45710_1 /ASSEMBLY_ACC=CAM_ASM_001126 /TAXON_ID=44452 /ORGANISM="Pavlova gyrans, Strain CCMP608" /LENGTH=139 /DNA_ID=CAMNT_0053433313 /DNA_START=36 /DNA_END=455 /DNA_ORIENTATION=+